MKREIIFRGKRVDNGEWVYGDLVHSKRCLDGVTTHHSLIGVDMDFFEVIPETVGQFTGLTDKNGKEIFEGDILNKIETDYDLWEQNEYEGDEPFHVTKTDVATMDRLPRFWMVSEEFGYEGDDLESPTNWEVIGNIHDNPELLIK